MTGIPKTRFFVGLRVESVHGAIEPYRRPISSQRPLSTNKSSQRKTLESGLGEFGFTWWVKPAIAITPMQRSVSLLLASVTSVSNCIFWVEFVPARGPLPELKP